MSKRKSSSGRVARKRAYAVGKGRPPTASRWVKGQSGNPSGRPKQALERTLDDFLSEEVKLNVGGKPQTFTRRELAHLNLATKAAKGDHRATLIMLEHDRRKAAGDRKLDPMAFDPKASKAILDSFRDEIRRQMPAEVDETGDDEGEGEA